MITIAQVAALANVDREAVKNARRSDRLPLLRPRAEDQHVEKAEEIDRREWQRFTGHDAIKIALAYALAGEFGIVNRVQVAAASALIDANEQTISEARTAIGDLWIGYAFGAEGAHVAGPLLGVAARLDTLTRENEDAPEGNPERAILFNLSQALRIIERRAVELDIDLRD